MNCCPSCDRNLASTLSVCPSCGTMVHDSVREELASKISPLAGVARTEFKQKPVPKPIPPVVQAPPAVPNQAAAASPAAAAPVNTPAAAPRVVTGELVSKPTSPTLVEFHSKNATVPEWRLQVQNAVRMRGDRSDSQQPQTKAEIKQTPPAPQRAPLKTNGATALQPEFAEKSEPLLSDNPKLANALRRIEASRQKYFDAEKEAAMQATAAAQPKTFPYVVTSKAPDFSPKKFEAEKKLEAEAANFAVKPKFTASYNELKAEKFDTNKLPPLPERVKIAPVFEGKVSAGEPVSASPIVEKAKEKKTFLNCEVIEQVDAPAYEETEVEGVEYESEEIDDCAPVSLRFNAGLFDLIIGAFISALLLSPFMLLNGRFFTTEGLFAFLATFSIVMFVYLTTTIGIMGRTYGMRLFSLEIIDVDDNEYPSLHQAAVSSSVYLLSLAFGGVGFLTLFLNDEKRAAHDLLSGTIVVKEN